MRTPLAYIGRASANLTSPLRTRPPAAKHTRRTIGSVHALLVRVVASSVEGALLILQVYCWFTTHCDVLAAQVRDQVQARL